MLTRLPDFSGVPGPIVLVVMDGVGIAPATAGNAVANAHTPVLSHLMATRPFVTLRAHGTAVGMPSDDDMGNSEVGHNALGSGQVYEQGAALVAKAIASGDLFGQSAWRDVVSNVRDHASTLHFLGLFSDGNVHAHIDHLKALIVRAKADGARRVRVHILLDGRDVPETSALDYVTPFEAFLGSLSGPDFDASIASGGGRMVITMDRYEADWGMVEKGWATHVLGRGPRFSSATAAIEAARAATPGISDQNLPPFVIAENGGPIGPIEDGDSVVFFNFRGDRAIEISRAFTEETFSVFDRVQFPRVTYAGMLQYDGDLAIPPRFLVPPPAIKDTMSEYLCGTGISQLAISETQKYGHVTYFWNGNRSGKFNSALEDYIEVPSDRVPFEERPWMKAAEVTDALIAALKTGNYRFARVNYANGDMVGHTGNYDAAIVAVETVDLQLARLIKVVDALRGALLITADHGNADEMFELNKKTGAPATHPDGTPKAKTSHTLNPVPFILYENVSGGGLDLVPQEPTLGLSNVAATVAGLLGYAAPGMWAKSLLRLVK